MGRTVKTKQQGNTPFSICRIIRNLLSKEDLAVIKSVYVKQKVGPGLL